MPKSPPIWGTGLALSLAVLMITGEQANGELRTIGVGQRRGGGTQVNRNFRVAALELLIE